MPLAPPSTATAVRLLVALALVLLLLLPFNLTAVAPLTVRVVDADKDPVAGACVTEVWPAYSARSVEGANVDSVAHTASGTLRSDSAGVVRFPPRSASANGFQRVADLVPRLVTRVTGGTPKPTVFLTVLGPGYQGGAVDLTPTNGTVSIPIRGDVQAPALRARLAKSCTPLAITGTP